MAVERMVRVSSKGQIVLPKQAREELGIREGDYLTVQGPNEGALTIRKSSGRSLEEMTRELRKEVRARGITCKQLDQWIEEVRGELPGL